MFCRAGAMDLCKTYTKINSSFPGKLKLIGIGLELIGYEDFKKGKFFGEHDVYIDKNKGIYKALKMKRPGCLSCWGFCNKQVFAKKKDIDKNYADQKLGMSVDFKKDLFQMGGSLLISPKGLIILEHIDAFYGDHVKEEDLMEACRNYFQEE